MNSSWVVYILECRNGSLYTGITNDLFERVKAHQSGKGAKYTRAFGVKRLAYQEPQPNRAHASKREAEIQSWTRNRKLELIKSKKK